MKLLPVMFGFFIMGFVDIIGMTVNYIKTDFSNLNDTMANMLAISCYVWFLLLSVPTGLLMNRIGRKKTVLLSFLLQVVAFALVSVNYSYAMVMFAFSLVGIGNTILQVALNPLVSDVVQKDKLTGTLTFGQFLKAVSSFIGPILVSWFVVSAYGWKLIFPVYSVISIVGLIWLSLVPIEESENAKGSSISIGNTFSLLKDKFILLFFIGILVLVGVDVGMNVTLPKYLQETCGMDIRQASMGNSVYFFARTLGAFAGGVILMKVSERKFFNFSIILGLAGLLPLLFVSNISAVYASVILFGIGYSNLFAIIFRQTKSRHF